MGVQGLWELLAPVGRRVSVETLTGKKLAIDASIWMIQFMKAMRDDKGEMVRNAHILGFFRRICKLLYLRTKPVFVFDGGTPALKRRTVIARRRQRENAQAKIRKTAEKLLLNHVKAMRLKELAADLENQRQKNDVKGNKAIIEEPNIEHNTQKENDEVPKSWSREELDEILAASLAAEENEGFTADAPSSSAARSPGDKVYEDEEEDEGEEMILPEMHGKVDPAILAALPPSMQLDLLVQMRERLMAENRQRYQKVKKVPSRFSELQIQAYLKTVAFRREIDVVQKSAVGRGVGGVQTSRIASEANREFIFSSSFTGDKQVLTSAGQESGGNGKNQNLPVESFNRAINEVMSIARSDALNGPTEDQTGNAMDHDVNTYLDERGNIRVSRVRAMGIRMTRDLQRNLDLMKEIEKEKADANQHKLNGATTAKALDEVLSNVLERNQHHEVENQNNDGTHNKDTETDDASEKIGNMEISFEDTGHNYGHDDDIFATLVAGHPSVVDLTTAYSASMKQSLDSDSDIEWEEGVTENKRDVAPSHFKAETKLSFMDEGTNNEVDVEWEEGFQGIQVNSSSFPDKIPRTVSKGALVEEAEFQEAIRRSLEDLIDNRTLNNPHEDQEQGKSDKMVHEDDTWRSVHEANIPQVEGPARDAIQPIGSTQMYDITETNPNESLQKQKVFNEDGVGSGPFSAELFMASDTLLEEQDLCRTKDQIIDTCSMGGNEHLMNKPVDTSGGEPAHNSDSSSMSCSFTNSNPEKLHDTDRVDAQRDMSHAAVDEPFCGTEKSARISANDSLTDADCTKELTDENVFVGLPIENEMPDRNPFSIDVVEHVVKEVDLQEEMIFLHKEREELGIEQRKLERNAESVSSEMFAECQELLQMFGLPYIIAPMEAEAQCAYMEFFNLVDGVVTDDSDAFLFGARSVYKNIFDDRKYVETYLLKDIENELGLNREKLINMALLLGSDYTEGVSGIGIVNAMEVVNAFPEKTGLHEFREWIESPDPTILRNFDGQEGEKSKSKGSKDQGTLKSSSSNVEEKSRGQNNFKLMKEIFMEKHRNVSKNWHIPSSFPSDAVISAYTSPQVDKSNEPFLWGKPDLFALRKLCWEKFGWGSSKADELLLPVLKEYNKHETQLRLEAFYSFNERFAKIRSKRIEKAVKGITGNKSSELIDEEMPQQSRVGKKRKAKPSELEAETSGTGSKEPERTGTANQISSKKETNAGLSKRGRKENASKLDGSNLEQSTSIEQSLIRKGKSGAGGRQKARGRQKETGGGSRKRNPHFEDAETSHDDDDNDNGLGYREKEVGLQFDKSEESHQVRRSGRLHKVVNYCIPDEFDDRDKESEVDKETTTEDSPMEPCVDGKDPHVDGVENGIGGEIFVDETKLENMTDKTRDDYYSGEDQSPREYLQFGGGFCSGEEDEDNEFGGRAVSSNRESTSEKINMLTGFDEEKPETGSLNLNSNQRENLSTTDISDTQIMKDNVDEDSNLSSTMLMDSLPESGNDYGSLSMRFLRAMPNLRRKKKKK